MTQPKYYLPGELTDELALHKLAINEEGIIGVISAVKQLGPTKVYIGFELHQLEDWVSLVPSVLYGTVHPFPLMELVKLLGPPEELKNVKVKIKEQPHFFGPYGPDAWNEITLSDTERAEFKDMMGKFFLSDPKKNINPFNTTDFRLDNDPEDNNNK